MKIEHIDENIRVRLLKLFEGDTQMAEEWLTTPKVVFNNETPLDVLDTPHGHHKVLEVISRIELGDLS
ncbi:antitoxin Xre/MbcA/ParS toxin-binding domain-containing protein [Vibrio sp. 10N.286.51.E5]|uniref:antitoxin Xre/MbcA/ParS toxin-binding domain-containing protein n=1 Tax=Vibrio sp. 10N.286.51.E5 TaxID=3229709 RepID=UPI003553E283